MPGVKVSPKCQRRENSIPAWRPAWAPGWAQRKTHSPQESVKGAGQPFPPRVAAEKPSAVVPQPSGVGQGLKEGLLTLELTTLWLWDQAGVPGRKGRVGPRTAFMFTTCRGLVSALARSPLDPMIGVCVWRRSPCPVYHLSPPLHANE